MEETRQDKEREFHDRAFGEGTRRTAAKFYALEGPSDDFYREFLAERCAGRRVLEYGCGPGSAAFFLAERGARVTGIDISDVAIEQATAEGEAKGLGDRLEFTTMDAEALEFPDDSFELVCGTGILHHLNLDRAYGELRRVLTEDGEGIFIEPLGHNPLINLYRKRTPELRTEDEHPLLASDLERARDFFADVGLRYFHLQTLLALPMRRSKRFDRIVGALNRADQALFRVLPPVRRHAWMVALMLAAPRARERAT
jgi:SAM-dependent methyltransferase